MSDELQQAKEAVLANLDAFTADLREKIESVESIEALQAQGSTAKKVADEILKHVTGGIMDLGIEYTAYTPGASPPAHIHPSTHNSWINDQNALILKHNFEQSGKNMEYFFTGHFSKIDSTYEGGYWPVPGGGGK